MGSEPKKLGAGFWIIVLVAVVLDTTDLLSKLLSVILSFSVFLSPLGFLVEALSWGADLLFGFIIGMYLFLSGVRADTRKIATVVLSIFIELVPILGMLPMETIMLFIIRHYHNKDAQKSIKNSSSRAAVAGNEAWVGA